MRAGKPWRASEAAPVRLARGLEIRTGERTITAIPCVIGSWPMAPERDGLRVSPAPAKFARTRKSPDLPDNAARFAEVTP